KSVAKPGKGSGKPLVIVESGSKAKTISGYLGGDYIVEASVGHIRDLPRNAADVPAAYKGQAWARLGVNVDNGFEPLYVVSTDRKKQVNRLKSLVKDASELYLATDEDREGEAIAWHLIETLKPTVPVRRMVFHEVTREAILTAIANPRDLDTSLVDAQETRRILDRLYGYEVSPVLWKKVMPKLSAGRVQSVATRIVVERERERMRFVAADYWGIEGDFALRTATTASDNGDSGEPKSFRASLALLDDSRVATGRDFDASTGRAKSDVVHLDESWARGLVARLGGADFTVTRTEEKPYRRRPYPPFMTSTLQMEAGRKLRWSSATVMRVAQRLYENGHITYMRTDSTTLSETALSAARKQARELYGDAYIPAEPRRYTRKVKNAQEAHEAIRPSGDAFRTPGQLAGALSSDEFRLYELIWKRTVASQMADAVGTSLSVRLTGTSSTGEVAEFSASGKTITFPGFLRAYVESSDDETAENEDSERRLPALSRGQELTARELEPKGHSTSPPARYTEPSLVGAMEELGIGRPSTYASIMQTIQDRGYVWKKGAALVPSFVAFAVVGLLEQNFARLVDYGFTASVEGDLDDIATGERRGVDWLTRFYFGSDTGQEGGIARSGGLKKLVSERLGDIDARGVNSIPLRATYDGKPVVVRVGRYGPYLQADGDDGERASLPDDIAPDELTQERVAELLSAPSSDRSLGPDPETGHTIMVKAGRYGPYVSMVLPEGSDEKPPTASLFASMTPETVTLEQARQLLTLPRPVGELDGERVEARNGRYGPYLSKGTDSRSLDAEEKLFTVTLDEARALFAQPKLRGRRGAAAPPLKELGDDPSTGKPMVVKDGRFGPYVTDGETNASLRKGDEVETLTVQRAIELLADRRARGPAPKRVTKKATAKKATAKKATAKRATAKRATAKKAAIEKATADSAG
ncbi:MAG: type I DNA topoisomerase, partial [Geodermatophilaceae bacterium]|nr:type I DNA topoisomerase [Geodermatophilaceae bacterium]